MFTIHIAAVHLHVQRDDALILEAIEKTGAQIMSVTKAQFDQLAATFNTETTRVGDLVIALGAKIKAGGMTADEEQAAFDALTAAGERLKAITIDAPPSTTEVPV